MSFLICGRKKRRRTTWNVEHRTPPARPRPRPNPGAPALHPAWDSDLASMPYNPTFEMSRESFVIDRLWSEGHSCSTHMGHITLSDGVELPATIKTPREGIYANVHGHETAGKVQALMREVRILSNIGHHVNIVNLIGVNTTNVGLGEVYAALELCNGSPADYLQSRPHQPPGQIAKWAADIAAGMEYLALNRVVHMDLALENIFLSVEHAGEPPCAKVGCLEMARVLPAECDRVTFGEGRLIRWRHASLELMSHGQFSVASDIWAYGTTIWELVSPRQMPYGDIHDWKPDFAEQLTAGLRPDQPQHIGDKIYGILQSCWSEYPQLRPTFTELRTFFQSLDGEDLRSMDRFFDALYTGIEFGHYVPLHLVNNPVQNP